MELTDEGNHAMRERVVTWAFRIVLLSLVSLICGLLLAFVVATPPEIRIPIAAWALFVAGCEISVVVITWKL